MRRKLPCLVGGTAMVLAAVLTATAAPASAIDRGQPAADRDGDRRTDVGVLRVADNGDIHWIWRAANGGAMTDAWGNVDQGDVPVLGDFDGDRRNDATVYRPGSPSVFHIRGTASAPRAVTFGDETFGDLPAHGDFDGDGKADAAVVRPGKGADTWYVARSTGGFITQQWGDSALGDVAVPADYDGDGRTDIAVRRIEDDGSTVWYIRRSSGGASVVRWGEADDLTAVGDYDGDGASDVAIVRPMDAGNWRWFIKLSRGGDAVLDWGNWAGPDDPDNGNHDQPVFGDFTGDGKTDVAIWRPDGGAASWYIRRSDTAATNVIVWGDGDRDIDVFEPLRSLINTAGDPGPALSIVFERCSNFSRCYDNNVNWVRGYGFEPNTQYYPVSVHPDERYPGYYTTDANGRVDYMYVGPAYAGACEPHIFELYADEAQTELVASATLDECP